VTTILKVLVLLLITPLAWSSNNGNNHDSGDSTATSSGGESTSISGSGAAAGSNSLSGVVVVNHNTVHSGNNALGGEQGLAGGDTILSLNNQLEAVSASAASIRLSFCTDGASAQSKRGGFSLGGSSYLCDIQMDMGLTITSISQHLANNDKEAAQAGFKRLADLDKKAYKYIQDRSKTAPIGAWLRDIWPVFLLLLI